MWVKIGDIRFLLHSLWHIAIVYACYICGYSRYNCIKWLTGRLAKINIFYVKIFQMLSTNAFLFSNEEIALLSQYTDEVPYDQSDIDDSFRNTINEIGRENESLSIELRHQGLPIKAGTISVVYDGYIEDRHVVIKVQRKKAKENLYKAFNQFDILLKILSCFSSIKNLNLHEILRENRNALLSQTDFLKELENAERMRKNFHYIDYIDIPKVYPEFTEKNSSMIVMDFIEGKSIDLVADSDKDMYALLFARYVSKCIFFDRFFHADMHPGNIRFIENDDSQIGKIRRIGIIDFGIMGEITREEQDTAYRAYQMLDNNDWENLVELALEYYIEPKENVINMSFDNVKKVKEELIRTMSEPEWSNIGPEGLFALSKCLKPYNLCISKSFSKIELAVCVSASIHLSLGMDSDFKTAMKEAFGRIAAWELN